MFSKLTSIYFDQFNLTGFSSKFILLMAWGWQEKSVEIIKETEQWSDN